MGPQGRAWAQRARGGGLPGQRGVQRGRQPRQAAQAQAQRAAVPQERLHLRRARLRRAARLRARASHMVRLGLGSLMLCEH